MVHSKDFENALVKLLNNREEDLKDIEKDAVALLKCSDGQPRSTVTASSCSDFAVDLLKKRKLERKSSEYMNVKFILPTSNLVERFFSTAPYAYSDLRRNLLPYNLEMLLFLKLNQRFWDEKLVSSVL